MARFTVEGDYSSEGVACVRSLLDPSELDLLTAALDEAQARPSAMSSNLAANELGLFFNDFNTWRTNTFIRSIVWNTEIAAKAAGIVETSSLRLFHDHILVKSGEAPVTPWHQDRPYYIVEGPKNFSIWMSPGDVPIAEALTFSKGSHLLDRLFVPIRFRDGEPMEHDAALDVLDATKLDQILTECPEVSYALNPGDALIFDNRILHSARRTDSTHLRRALSLRFLGDGARMTWNGVNQTPPFHRLGLRFNEGDTPSDEWFPPVIG